MTRRSGAVLLGTVAIEPNRWATVDPSGAPLTSLADWDEVIAGLDVDGLELWDRHAASLGTTPVVLFNSYASFDDPDGAARAHAASTAVDVGASGMKFNVGNEPATEAAYVQRIVELADAAPSLQLLCECHHGISIAEDPAVAARIFDSTGLHADRLGAIVHTHESLDHVRARFDAYGDRVAHIHVNFLDFAAMRAPELERCRPALDAFIDVVRSRGFDGSWTIEFVAGLLTDDDRPEALLAQAKRDVETLRAALAP